MTYNAIKLARTHIANNNKSYLKIDAGSLRKGIHSITRPSTFAFDYDAKESNLPIKKESAKRK